MTKKYSDAEILALIEESSCFTNANTLSMQAAGAKKGVKYLFSLLLVLFALFITLFYQEIESLTRSILLTEKKVEFTYPPFSPLIQNFDLAALHHTALFLAEEKAMSVQEEESDLFSLQNEELEEEMFFDQPQLSF